MNDKMQMIVDDDGVLCMPKPLCTYADHSYPAYSVAQMRIVINQRDNMLSALKIISESEICPAVLAQVAINAIKEVEK